MVKPLNYEREDIALLEFLESSNKREVIALLQHRSQENRSLRRRVTQLRNEVRRLNQTLRNHAHRELLFQQTTLNYQNHVKQLLSERTRVEDRLAVLQSAYNDLVDRTVEQAEELECLTTTQSR